MNLSDQRELVDSAEYLGSMTFELSETKGILLIES
jgi:hypothetical protein